MLCQVFEVFTLSCGLKRQWHKNCLSKHDVQKLGFPQKCINKDEPVSRPEILYFECAA